MDKFGPYQLNFYRPYLAKGVWILWVISSLLFLFGCTDDPPEGGFGDPQLTILYTNDEHGWIEESSSTSGAAKLMNVWRDVEGYVENDRFLVLSGGDNWTGPAISTWFKGESMIAVMNSMDYSAAAIGNHEFDFQVSGLEARIEQADFPYLSANIRLKGSAERPGFATPYVLIEMNDIMVGIVGLTTQSASYSTFPTYVEDFDFTAYASALEEVVPELQVEGAEIILCIAHICEGEMSALVSVARDLGISMIGGGHCNQVVAEEINNEVALVQAGWQFAHYGRVDIWYDRTEFMVTDLSVSIHDNDGGAADPEVAAIVSSWQTARDEALGEIIGYAEAEIPRGSVALHNLVTDSWLEAFPGADIAITNTGGIRQAIPSGEITKADIVGVLPFDNNILMLELQGHEVLNCLSNHAVAGMSTVGGTWHADGTPFNWDSTYKVLTTDYLYVQDTQGFSAYDGDPYYTGLNYHQPTVDYILARETSPDNPLDQYLDGVARR